jgi:hypothetical protein
MSQVGIETAKRTLNPFRRVPFCPAPPLAFLPILFAVHAIYFDWVIFRLLTLSFPEGASGVDLGPDRVTLGLFGGLALVGAVWAFLVARQKVPWSTGAGFTLAVTGALIHVLATIRIGASGEGESIVGSASVSEGLDWARPVGVVVYAVGLGFVAVACLVERRATRNSRRNGKWVLPSGSAG